MANYVHSYLKPQSKYVRYRGKTNQVDVQATILGILEENPGLRGFEVASMIYDKGLMPKSYGYVYEVLGKLSSGSAPIVVRNENEYYLLKHAVTQGLIVTKETVDKLDELGVDLTTARFVSSGIVQYAEQVKMGNLEPEDYNLYKPTEAANVATNVYPDSNEPAITFEDEVDEEIDETIEQMPNFFNGLSEDEKAKMKDDAVKELLDEKLQTDVQKQRERMMEKLTSIEKAIDLVGFSVKIDANCVNPSYTNKTEIVGTILELRATGVTFMVTFSNTSEVPVGTILPLEYANGVRYQIMPDMNR